jgi:mRNA-degrading endonuclease toxin of MazEF toxin-antitoxin module
VIPTAGELWLADRHDEERRLVMVLSDHRLHTLAGRAVVAPLLPAAPEITGPWHLALDDGSVVAVHLFGTVAIERLLERTGAVPYMVLRKARQVVSIITS